ncbi:MAG: glycine dehydrogenase [candidate division Zixibacteria bacterium SM23_81]|nr:MAG: glycine dehydrogenase [candidate division Zixibacteria bacterium SM23_81]
MPYIANTDTDRQKMLEAIGVTSFEELLEAIPEPLRWSGELSLPSGSTEQEVVHEVQALSWENHSSERLVSFLGAGAYDHFLPGVVAELLGRSEFYTAYTPYQAEVSQGTLQSIFEFQTLICQLTDMDVANASMYDAASSMGEAALMAHAHTGRRDLVIAGTVNPAYLQTLRTYTGGLGLTVQLVPFPEGHLDLGSLGAMVGDETAAVFFQQPNFLGILEPQAEAADIARRAGALVVVCVDPISLGLLVPPGQTGADIVLGEGQALGNAMNFGGPFLGFFACKKELVRQMPGRLVGQTTDRLGRRGFVLTLQTREQHIRREKATSNICTNHALNALASTIYLSLMGREGLREVADLCLQKSHYAQKAICRLPGFRLRFERPFFKEFAVQVPAPPGRIIQQLVAEGLLAGVDLGRFRMGLDDCLLVAVTEKRTREQIDHLVEHLGKFATQRAT